MEYNITNILVFQGEYFLDGYLGIKELTGGIQEI